MYKNVVAFQTSDNHVIAYMPKYNFSSNDYEEDENYVWRCKNVSKANNPIDGWVAYFPLEHIAKKLGLKDNKFPSDVNIAIEKPFNEEDCEEGFIFLDSKDESHVNIHIDNGLMTIECRDDFGNSSSVQVEFGKFISSIEDAGNATLYDFENDATWVIAIDSASFGGKVSEYIENDGTKYTVKKAFTADVYIKLKYQNDQVYFELK